MIFGDKEKYFEEYLKAKKIGNDGEFLNRHSLKNKEEFKDFSDYISALNELSVFGIDPDKKEEIRKKIVTMFPIERSNKRNRLELAGFLNNFLKYSSAFALVSVVVFMIWFSFGRNNANDNLLVVELNRDFLDIGNDLNAIESELIFLDESEAVFNKMDLMNENL